MKSLNPDQRRAVKHDRGPLLVVAGAGTGKTAVITARIAYLVGQGKARPEEILALTFTDKAAKEMEDRVDRLLPLGVVQTRIMTFNSFGQWLLDEYGFEVGLPPATKLITKTQQLVFLRDHFDELKLKYFAPWSNPAGQLANLIDYFSKLRNELITPEQYTRYARGYKSKVKNRKSADAAEAVKQAELAQAYEVYGRLKRRYGLIDYDDQIHLAIDLLEQRPNLLREVRAGLKYLMVDEFQDTNLAQNRLLQLLSGPNGNLMVVGDDDQSIYKFRGAAVSNILAFRRRYKAAKQIVLKQNYRSTQALLDSAYRLIKHNNPDRLEAKYGFDKQLRAASRGQVPRLMLTDTHQQEAALLVADVKKQLNAGINPGDIAVLIRKHSQAVILEAALRRAGIGYRVSDQQKLHQQPEIELVLNFLQYISDSNRSDALYHLLEHAIFGLDLHALSLLAGQARRRNQPLADLLRQPTGDRAFDRAASNFLALAEHWRAYAAKHTVSELAYDFLDRSGLLARWEQQSHDDPSQAGKFSNLERWFNSLLEFQAVTRDRSARGYITSLGDIRELGDLLAYSEPDLSTQEVNILTIHQAKGLEFRVVYLFDLTADALPGSRRRSGLEVPVELVKGEVLPTGDWHIQEERRLMYVAMTRAKRSLIMSFAPDHGGKRAKKLSPFVGEALGKVAAATAPAKPGSVQRLSQFAAAPLAGLTRDKLERDGWLHLTPHQIDDYLTCPYNFRYRHILEVPLPIDPALSYGTLIHNVINHYFTQAKRGRVNTAKLLEMVDRDWNDDGFVSASVAASRRRQAVATVKRFIAREKGQELPTYSELPFKFEISEAKVIVSGRFDAVYQRPAGAEIRDFKTSQVEDGGKADTKAKTSIQLAIYGLAWQSLTGQTPTKLVLDYVETGQLGITGPRSEDLDEVKTKIMAVAKGIRAGQFPISGNCRYCAHRPLIVDREAARAR